MLFSDLFLAAEEPFVEMKALYIKQMEWSCLERGEAPHLLHPSPGPLWAQFENHGSADPAHFKSCPAEFSLLLLS